MGMTYAASSVGALIAPVASAAIFDGGNKVRENCKRITEIEKMGKRVNKVFLQLVMHWWTL